MNNLRRNFNRLILSAALACLGAAPAWQPSVSDMVALKHLALDHGPHLVRIAKSPTEMPPFDPDVYYPGNADPGWLWENRGTTTSPTRQRAESHALMLAAMDSGIAGAQWKQLYNSLAAQDRAQPKTASDPYRARHAFLQQLDAKLAALAPPFPQRTNDASLDAEAAKVTDDDISLVARGFFTTPVASRSSSLPAGVFSRYDGRTGLGTYVVETSSLLEDYDFYRDREPAGAEDAFYAARFQAIVDSGAAGASLKQRYDQSPDKARFGLVLARAYALLGERTAKQSREQIAWIRSNVSVGMTQDAVDALLLTHKLKMNHTAKSESLEFTISSNFACGTSIAVIITFDQQQRVSGVEEQPPYTACL